MLSQVGQDAWVRHHLSMCIAITKGCDKFAKLGRPLGVPLSGRTWAMASVHRAPLPLFTTILLAVRSKWKWVSTNCTLTGEPEPSTSMGGSSKLKRLASSSRERSGLRSGWRGSMVCWCCSGLGTKSKGHTASTAGSGMTPNALRRRCTSFTASWFFLISLSRRCLFALSCFASDWPVGITGTEGCRERSPSARDIPP